MLSHTTFKMGKKNRLPDGTAMSRVAVPDSLNTPARKKTLPGPRETAYPFSLVIPQMQTRLGHIKGRPNGGHRSWLQHCELTTCRCLSSKIRRFPTLR